MNAWIELDKKLFLWFNGLSGGPWDHVFGWTTHLITPLIFIPVLALMFIWDPKDVLRKFSAVLLTGLAGGALAKIVLKPFVDRPRPFNAFYDEIARGEATVNTMFQLYLSNSFPSGHSALVFAVATALVLVYGRKLLFLYIVAAALSLSRVYVGAHFPGDVLGGAVIGMLGALAVYPWIRPRLKAD